MENLYSNLKQCFPRPSSSLIQSGRIYGYPVCGPRSHHSAGISASHSRDQCLENLAQITHTTYNYQSLWSENKVQGGMKSAPSPSSPTQEVVHFSSPLSPLPHPRTIPF